MLMNDTPPLGINSNISPFYQAIVDIIVQIDGVDRQGWCDLLSFHHPTHSRSATVRIRGNRIGEERTNSGGEGWSPAYSYLSSMPPPDESQLHEDNGPWLQGYIM